MEELPKHVASGVFESSSPAQTEALGVLFGQLLEPGDVVVLTGDLGAGKTNFTKGVARGMGAHDEVTSPTFTIEMVYEGKKMPLYHFDLYRLDGPEQLEDTGLYDALESDGPCLIEWGEQFAEEIGPDRLDIFVRRLDDAAQAGVEPERRIELCGKSPRAQALIGQLDEAVDASTARE